MLEFKNISKNFGANNVLKDVNLIVHPGEVIALMGENGAGKSTLMKILGSIYPFQSYSGSILINHQIQKFTSVRDAQNAGISMILQELALFDDLTVAENILLEEQGFIINPQQIISTAQTFLDDLGFNISAKSLLKELSTGQAQLVEIARALRRQASIIIMDEPTSALTEDESEKLFKLILKLKNQNKIIFYISHRLEEIKRIADRIVVLRDGIIAGTMPVTNLSQQETINTLLTWMVGREVSSIYPERKNLLDESSKPFLEIQNLSIHSTKVKDIALKVFKSEIVGLAGLMGSGRSEIARAIYGLYNQAQNMSGQIILNQKNLQKNSPALAIKNKIGYLTEDRKKQGLFLNRSITENISITTLNHIKVQSKEEHDLVKNFINEFKIKGPGLKANVGYYSGGNQQKVALAKVLAAQPELLILDEPTRGVDINTKIEIYKLIAELKQQGLAILLISSELNELINLCDRLYVLKEGTIKAEFAASQFNAQTIIKAASL